MGRENSYGLLTASLVQRVTLFSLEFLRITFIFSCLTSCCCEFQFPRIRYLDFVFNYLFCKVMFLNYSPLIKKSHAVVLDQTKQALISIAHWQTSRHATQVQRIHQFFQNLGQVCLKTVCKLARFSSTFLRL